MTDKTTEALKLAEEALHAELEAINSDEFDAAADKCYEALAAIREALAEPVQQEPVGWKEFNEWMHQEIPSGTIIGDAGWWASRIYSKFIKPAAPQPVKQEPKDIKLPVDVTIGCGTIKAGCSLQTLLTRIKVINETWIPKMQSALQHKRGCSYERIDQDPSICTCGVTEARELLTSPVQPVKQEPVDKRFESGSVLVPNSIAWGIVGSSGHARKRNVDALHEILKAAPQPVNQEPLAKVVLNRANQITMQKPNGDYFDISKHVGEYFYAAPVSIHSESETDSSSSLMRTAVRTKDLTDDEIDEAYEQAGKELHRWQNSVHGQTVSPADFLENTFARAVIAAFKEKNR